MHLKVHVFQKIQAVFTFAVSSLTCLFYFYTTLCFDASHIAGRSPNSSIARRYIQTESLSCSIFSCVCSHFHIPHLSSVCYTFPPLCPSSPSSTSLSYLFPFSPRQRDGHWGVTLLSLLPPPFKIPPLLLLLPSKSLQADYGESERGRQKEIHFCLPSKPSSSHRSPTDLVVTPPKSLLAGCRKIKRDREGSWRERDVWESAQQGDSSQDGRKLPMLFFSNPFLISGFGRWERIRR